MVFQLTWFRAVILTLVAVNFVPLAGCQERTVNDSRTRSPDGRPPAVKSVATPASLPEVHNRWSGPVGVGHDVEVPIGMPFDVFRLRYAEASCFSVGPDLGCEVISPGSEICPALTACDNVLVIFRDGFLTSYTATFAKAGDWDDLRRRFVEDGRYQLSVVPPVAGVGALAWKWRSGSSHLVFFRFMDVSGDSSGLRAPYGFGFGDAEFAPNSSRLPTEQLTNNPRPSAGGAAIVTPDVPAVRREEGLTVADKLRELEDAVRPSE